MNPVDRLSPDGAAVFLFHGVIAENRHTVRNYTGKHVRQADFATMMTALAERGTALSMDQVLDHCQSGRPFPANSFAITFDDGFANNLTIAAPILEGLGIPATYYVTTGFVAHNGMSWIDRIEYLFERLDVPDIRLDWEAGPRSLADAAAKKDALTAIRRHVKSQPGIDFDAFVHSIYALFDREPVMSSDDPLDLKLTWPQVCELAVRPGATIGGHSHRHSILSFLSPQDLEAEIDLSLSLLKDKAGIGPRHYCYPEGLTHCYNQQVIDCLRRRGVECCPSAEDGLVRPGDDPFHLRRILVG